MLLAAMLSAPLIGFTDNAPTVAHRVDMNGIPVADWETATAATAACGAEVRLLAVRNQPASWVNLRTRGTPFTRCPGCRASRKREVAE